MRARRGYRSATSGPLEQQNRASARRANPPQEHRRRQGGNACRSLLLQQRTRNRQAARLERISRKRSQALVDQAVDVREAPLDETDGPAPGDSRAESAALRGISVVGLDLRRATHPRKVFTAVALVHVLSSDVRAFAAHWA